MDTGSPSPLEKAMYGLGAASELEADAKAEAEPASIDVQRPIAPSAGVGTGGNDAKPPAGSVSYGLWLRPLGAVAAALGAAADGTPLGTRPPPTPGGNVEYRLGGMGDVRLPLPLPLPPLPPAPLAAPDPELSINLDSSALSALSADDTGCTRRRELRWTNAAMSWNNVSVSAGFATSEYPRGPWLYSKQNLETQHRTRG